MSGNEEDRRMKLQIAIEAIVRGGFEYCDILCYA